MRFFIRFMISFLLALAGLIPATHVTAVSDTELVDDPPQAPGASGWSIFLPFVGVKPCPGCYYVDGTTGSNSNPGTSPDQAWRTIQKAADSVSPGGTVTVFPGDYPERVFVTRSGTPDAPIAFRADGRVIMRGFTVRAHYISITGFEITNTPDDSQDGYGIWVEGSQCVLEGNVIHFATRGGIQIYAQLGKEDGTSYCTVRNNRLYRNALAGIEVFGRNHLVEGNEIWGTIQYHPNWANPPDWVDADGIKFFGSGHIIRNNNIHDILYGIPENKNPHIDCFQTFSNPDREPAQNIIIENNICRNVQAQSSGEIGKGLMLEDANQILIRNNIIQAFNNVNINGSTNITIVNNVMTSSLSLNMGFEPEGVAVRNGPNTVVKNNIFYDLPNHIVYIHDNASNQGLDVGYNCIYNSNGKSPSGSPYPHDLWQVNPLFENPQENDFHLHVGSPAIDAGITISSVTHDIDGVPRPAGNGYDMGAFER